jgi:hypothetical protein
MRRIMCMTMVMLSFATALQAQEPANKRRAATPPPAPPPAAPRSRVGYAASPTPPQSATSAQPTYIYSPDGYNANGASFLVLSDGSMLANFGNGYERVLRRCASHSSSAQSQQEATGRDALGRILPPPGIAALQAGTRGQVTGTAPARNATACYRSVGRGRTEVITGERASGSH